MLRTHVRSFGRTDNVKTVYPPTNTVCGGYNEAESQAVFAISYVRNVRGHAMLPDSTVCKKQVFS